MSQPSDEIIILREMLDIHERSTRMLRDAGIPLDPDDAKKLVKLEKQLERATSTSR